MTNQIIKRNQLIIEIVLVAIALAITPWIIQNLINQEESIVKECAFCSDEVLKRQTLYEGEKTLVLSNYRPLLPGHSLVLPKRHIARFEELTAEENEELRLTMNKVQRAFEEVYGTDEYLLVLQNGPKAGQTVAHLHFHMIPRVEMNILTKAKLWFTMLGNTPLLTAPLNEKQLAEAYAPLKAALNKKPQILLQWNH